MRLPERESEKSEKFNIEADDLRLDREKYLVYKSGQEIILPKKEFELLALLISNPGKVFTRDEIFRTVWGDGIIVGDRTIDVHIGRLREKLKDDPNQPAIIHTVRGKGYMFELKGE